MSDLCIYMQAIYSESEFVQWALVLADLKKADNIIDCICTCVLTIHTCNLFSCSSMFAHFFVRPMCIVTFDWNSASHIHHYWASNTRRCVYTWTTHVRNVNGTLHYIRIRYACLRRYTHISRRVLIKVRSDSSFEISTTYAHTLYNYCRMNFTAALVIPARWVISLTMIDWWNTVSTVMRFGSPFHLLSLLSLRT